MSIEAHSNITLVGLIIDYIRNINYVACHSLKLIINILPLTDLVDIKIKGLAHHDEIMISKI